MGAAEDSELHQICALLGLACLCELHLVLEQGAAAGREGSGEKRWRLEDTVAFNLSHVFGLVLRCVVSSKQKPKQVSWVGLGWF